MSNVLAFILGVWTLAWFMVIHEGEMPFVGYLIFGVAYVAHILLWDIHYKEERNGK